ncbi:hypothetical protein GCM10023238_18630 [Streptomyces heliomycini]
MYGSLDTGTAQNGYKGSRNGRFLPRLPGPNADLWDWQLLAACRGVGTARSSSTRRANGARARKRSRELGPKEVCMRGPVRAECAAHALAVREPYGVCGAD